MHSTLREMMVVAAAREVRDGELVFVGMRLPLLSFLLAQATHAPHTVGLYENGLIRARAAERMLYTMSDPANVTGATRAAEMLEIMGLAQSGRVGLGFLGAAQVDRFGNLNSTQVLSEEGVTRLPGSGGASDIASLTGRFVVIMSHQRHRFPENVDYMSSPGYGSGAGWRRRTGLPRGGPAAIVTDRGVLRFHPESKEAVLSSYHPGCSPDETASETGWPLRFADDLHATPGPSDKEISILRKLDPGGFWLG